MLRNRVKYCVRDFKRGADLINYQYREVRPGLVSKIKINIVIRKTQNKKLNLRY